MQTKSLFFPAGVMAFASLTLAAPVVSWQTSNPSTGALDQFSFNDAGAEVGGQDYTDNGSPGQSFTVPAGSKVYLERLAFKLDPSTAGHRDWESDPIPFTPDCRWGIQVARYSNSDSGGFADRPTQSRDGTPGYGEPYDSTFINSGTNPTTQVVWEGLNGGFSAPPGGTGWLVFTFAGEDRVTLDPGKTYSFQLHSNGGWVKIMRSAESYSGGTAFHAWNSQRDFNDNWVQDAGGDRTFYVGLSAVPEPGTLGFLAGLGLLLARRHRKA